MTFAQFAVICIGLFVVMALTSDNMDDDDEGPGGGLMQPAYQQQ